MYVTDWRLDAIIRLHKLTGEGEETLVREPQTNRLYGVKIYSRTEQNVTENHPCHQDNGGCQKLCFAIPRSDGQLMSRCGMWLTVDCCRFHILVVFRLSLWRTTA